MHVYIPFLMVMFEHAQNKSRGLVELEKLRASRIEDDRLPWIQYNVGDNYWTYFEVAIASPGQFMWHVGTYEDFTNLLMMPNAESRYAYAKEYCRPKKIIGGKVCDS